ncbi:LamG-like jellyroll fold domain-containing protein [Kitasatospora acidiphila]|uniref:LamG-like jellyroll fold domain-containing protein n=1 Tax=Kitasatospora acidiphila TaxID=2567942 RepID=UPI003C7157F5
MISRSGRTSKSQILPPGITARKSGTELPPCPASIELWFKTTTSGILYSYQSNALGSSQSDYNPALYVGADGKIHGQFWTGSATNALTSDRTVTDGNWHQVVLAGDDSGQTIYLDGTKSATTTSANKITYNGTPYVYLGAGVIGGSWPSIGNSYFNGSIAEAAYFQNRLSDATVAAHYKAMGNASTPTPVTTAKVTDPTGNTLAYRYDTFSAQLISTSDAWNNTTRYAYDTGGFLYAVTDPGGHTVTTGHDAHGNTVSRTVCKSPTSCQTSYATYALSTDPSNPTSDKVLTSSDARSSGPSDTTYNTTYTYSSTGQLLSATTPATPDFPKGRVTYTTWTYGTETAADGSTVPAGLIKAKSQPLDASQYSQASSVPANQQTTYQYRHNGDLASSTSALGDVSTYDYDNLGRLSDSSETCPDCPGGTAGPPAQPRSLVTSYTWDGQGNLVTRTDPYTTDAVTGVKHTRLTTTAYDVDGEPLSETVSDTTGGDPSRTTTWAYMSTMDRLWRTTDPAGHNTTYTYDSYGNVATKTDAAGTNYQYSYSPQGWLQQTAIANFTGNPNSPVTAHWQVIDSRAYDPAGRLTTDTDAMGRTRHTYYYDDNSIAETDLDGFHNADGMLRNVVLSQLTYDAAGHVTNSVTGGGKSTVVTSYDAAGRTTSTVLDPGGLNRITSYTYDAANRPLTVVQSGGSDHQEVDYSYDPMGELLKKTVKGASADAVTTYGYNSRGMVTSTVSPNGNAAGATPANFTSTQAYDEAGRPTVSTGPLVSSEVYDPVARNTTPQQVHAVSMSGYDTFGERTSTKDPAGNIMTFTYDPAGNQVAATGSAYADPRTGSTITPTSTTQYDAMDRPTTRTVDPTGLNLTTTSTYDQLGNLVEQDLPVASGTTPKTFKTYDLDGEPASIWRQPCTDRGSARRACSMRSYPTRCTARRTGNGTTWARTPRPNGSGRE